MYNLANLDPAVKDRLTVVTIGNINNPQGLWSRLGFLPTIPFLNISFGPQLPTNIGIKSTNYSFEYDPVGDAPQYWGNPLAMLNALAAFEYVHGYYLVPNSNDPTGALPYGYTPETLATAIDNADKRTYQDATFVLIPHQGTLPLMQPFMDIAAQTGTTALVKPVVDLFSPVTKVLINLGYDRTVNPGIPQILSILPFNPFQNWIGVGFDLLNATGEGIQAFLNDVGIGAAIAPVAPAPVTTSTLAVRTFAPQATDPQEDAPDSLASVTALSSAKKSAPVVTETDAVEVAGATERATETVPAKGDATVTEPAAPVEPTTKPETTKPEETAKPETTTTAETTADDAKKDTATTDTEKKDTEKKDSETNTEKKDTEKKDAGDSTGADANKAA
jgi:hypothetical protein